MTPRLKALIVVWSLRAWSRDEELLLTQDEIQYFGRNVFDDYEPSPFDQFEDRLDRWLHNVASDDDKESLFRLLNHLFFIGRSEFESLCRAAFNGPILRWIVDLLYIGLSDPDAKGKLNAGVEQTWFCPITDSMRINSFLKVNQLKGKSHRPDWRSLKRFGDRAQILDYVTVNKIRRLVLLEDFVGSGTQMESAIRFAASIDKSIEILALPLVVCPAGDEVGLALANELENVSYEPVMRITAGTLLKPEPQKDEPALFAKVRDLIRRVRSRLDEQEPDAESQKCHGYKGTGAVFAMYSNCPNNTLPIIHNELHGWSALFPRIERA